MADMLAEVGGYMTSPVMRIDAEASVQDAAVLMEGNNVGSLIVEAYGDDVGILTEKDFTQKVLAKGKNPEDVLVTEIMSKPILTMDKYMPVEEANRYMKKNNIRHLPITDDDKIVGMLSIKDLVSYFSRDFQVREDF